MCPASTKLVEAFSACILCVCLLPLGPQLKSSILTPLSVGWKYPWHWRNQYSQLLDLNCLPRFLPSSLFIIIHKQLDIIYTTYVCPVMTSTFGHSLCLTQNTQYCALAAPHSYPRITSCTYFAFAHLDHSKIINNNTGRCAWHSNTLLYKSIRIIIHPISTRVATRVDTQCISLVIGCHGVSCEPISSRCIYSSTWQTAMGTPDCCLQWRLSVRSEVSRENFTDSQWKICDTNEEYCLVAYHVHVFKALLSQTPLFAIRTWKNRSRLPAGQGGS